MSHEGRGWATSVWAGRAFAAEPAKAAAQSPAPTVRKAQKPPREVMRDAHATSAPQSNAHGCAHRSGTDVCLRINDFRTNTDNYQQYRPVSVDRRRWVVELKLGQAELDEADQQR